MYGSAVSGVQQAVTLYWLLCHFVSFLKQHLSTLKTFQIFFLPFTTYASQCQGQGGDKQGLSGTRRDKAGTNRDKQRQAETSRESPCLSLYVPVCSCLSLFALSVSICLCLSLSVLVCPCLSIAIPACLGLFLCVTIYPCLSLSVLRRFGKHQDKIYRVF